MLKKNDIKLAEFLKLAVTSGAVIDILGYSEQNKVVVDIQGKLDSSSVTDNEVSLMVGGTKVFIGTSSDNIMFLNNVHVTRVQLISNNPRQDAIIIEN